MVKCQTELYKEYTGNPEFRASLNDTLFSLTYRNEE